MKASRVKERVHPLGYRLRPDVIEDMRENPFHGSARNIELHDPMPTSLLPENGAWVMIMRRLPPMERNLDEHVRVGRIFFAERRGGTDHEGFLPDGTYQIRLTQPWDVTLFPWEYKVMDPVRIVEYWREGAYIFHPLKMDDARFNEIVFFARSRGIGLADAVSMALGTLMGPVGWFECVPEVAEYMEALERRVNAWPPLSRINHARRRLARRRARKHRANTT